MLSIHEFHLSNSINSLIVNKRLILCIEKDCKFCLTGVQEYFRLCWNIVEVLKSKCENLSLLDKEVKEEKMDSIYSDIRIVSLPKMRIARYVIISPNPEHDSISYMDNWARNSGLLDLKDYKSRRIGWDFPIK